MSVVIRCPACLTALPAGARRCGACGLDFARGATRRASGVLLAIVLALATGAAAWWLRGRSEGGDPPELQPGAPPEPAPAREAAAVAPPAFDGAAAVPGSTPVALPAAGAVDSAALAALAGARFQIETRDREGNRLRTVTAFRVGAPAADALFAFPALNGAATLARTATVHSAEARTDEVAALDGQDLALAAGLAPVESADAPLAPSGSIGVGSRVFALDEAGGGAHFTPAGTVTAVLEPPGAAVFATTIACEQRWVADSAGRLIGLARAESDGLARIVVLDHAMRRMQTSRPARLAQIDATFFDRDGPARRERATLYAANGRYADALKNYLLAIDLEPRLREEVAAPATACAQLALRAARLDDAIAPLLPVLERAAEVLDREPFVLHACGLALLDQGEPERALSYLIDAAGIAGADRGELGEAVRAAYVHAGEAARAERRAADAILLLEEGLLRFREDPQLLKSLGFAYYELGDRDRARIVLEKVASLDEAEARGLEPLLAALAPARRADDGTPSVEIRFDRGSGAVRTSARFAGRVEAGVIIDTGATISAISERLADRLRVDRARPLRRVQITTASGRLEAPVVRLESIDVQGARVTDVDVVVLPLQEEGGGEALIGLNFLEHFSLSLDARRGVLRLSPKR